MNFSYQEIFAALAADVVSKCDAPGSKTFCLDSSTDEKVFFDFKRAGSGPTDSLIVSELPPKDNRPWLQVSCIEEAFGMLHAHANGNPHEQMKFVGITGTNGKTSTAWYLYQILRLSGKEAAYIGTLGCIYGGKNIDTKGFTTPPADIFFRVLRDLRQDGVEWCVVEDSSHGLHQKRTFPVTYDASILTSLSHDHLDYHGTFSNYAAAKSQLFSERTKAEGLRLIHRAAYSRLSEVQTLSNFETYSRFEDQEPSSNDFFVERIGSKTIVQIQKHRFATNLLPGFPCDNLCAAILTAANILDQFPRPEIVEAVEMPPGRMETVSPIGHDRTVIVDFAHTPDALAEALKCCRQAAPNACLWVVFGCGGDRDRAKRPMMARVSQELADQIIVTQDNPRSENPDQIIGEIVDGFTGDRATQATIIMNRRDAILYALHKSSAGDCILIAGKGNENYQHLNGKKIWHHDATFIRNHLETPALKEFEL